MSTIQMEVSVETAMKQLIIFLSAIKGEMDSHGNFCNRKSAVATAFNRVFGFDVGQQPRMTTLFKGWMRELPPKPRHAPDGDYWDVGAIVEYWSKQPDNDDLSDAELGYKAISLFAVAVYPRVSDCARLARDTFVFVATGFRYRFFGTKELRSVPVFTKRQGLSNNICRRVCAASAVEAYIVRTGGDKFVHQNRHYGFCHTFMSQTANKYDGKHYPVGSQTCSRWIRIIMNRVGVDPKFKGGSVRMAAASAALDRGEPLEIVLATGRWSSWAVFNAFYNRARVNAVAPPIGRTSLA